MSHLACLERTRSVRLVQVDLERTRALGSDHIASGGGPQMQIAGLPIVSESAKMIGWTTNPVFCRGSLLFVIIAICAGLQSPWSARTSSPAMSAAQRPSNLRKSNRRVSGLEAAQCARRNLLPVSQVRSVQP